MPAKRSAATGFVGRVGAVGNATTYGGTANYGNFTGILRKMLNRSHGSRKAKATLLALTGAAVGGASKAYSNNRISAGRTAGQAGQGPMLGGKRTIETVAHQTGVTVAQDLTDFDTRISASVRVQPSSVKGVRQGGYEGKLI